jgi:NTE family protein
MAYSRKVNNIVHLIYRARNYEGHSKDYEFSRVSMQEHWRAGYHDGWRTFVIPRCWSGPPTARASPSISL